MALRDQDAPEGRPSSGVWARDQRLPELCTATGIAVADRWKIQRAALLYGAGRSGRSAQRAQGRTQTSTSISASSPSMQSPPSANSCARAELDHMQPSCTSRRHAVPKEHALAQQAKNPLWPRQACSWTWLNVCRSSGPPAVLQELPYVSTPDLFIKLSRRVPCCWPPQASQPLSTFLAQPCHALAYTLQHTPPQTSARARTSVSSQSRFSRPSASAVRLDWPHTATRTCARRAPSLRTRRGMLHVMALPSSCRPLCTYRLPPRAHCSIGMMRMQKQQAPYVRAACALAPHARAAHQPHISPHRPCPSTPYARQ
jgi:hypothetical protein